MRRRISRKRSRSCIPSNRSSAASMRTVPSARVMRYQPGRCPSVRLTDGVRKDRILHCTDSTVTAHYADIRFRGTFAVVSYTGRSITAIYLGNATSFRAKGIRISGEAPFDGWFVLDHGVWKYRSRQQITVKGRRKAIPAGL